MGFVLFSIEKVKLLSKSAFHRVLERFIFNKLLMVWPVISDYGFYSMGLQKFGVCGFEFSKTIEIYRRVKLEMVQPFDSQ